MGKSRTNQVTITGTSYFDLEDVRWLMEQAHALDPSAHVRITYYTDQREGTSSTLSITLED